MERRNASLGWRILAYCLTNLSGHWRSVSLTHHKQSDSSGSKWISICSVAIILFFFAWVIKSWYSDWLFQTANGAHSPLTCYHVIDHYLIRFCAEAVNCKDLLIFFFALTRSRLGPRLWPRWKKIWREKWHLCDLGLLLVVLFVLNWNLAQANDFFLKVQTPQPELPGLIERSFFENKRCLKNSFILKKNLQRGWDPRKDRGNLEVKLQKNKSAGFQENLKMNTLMLGNTMSQSGSQINCGWMAQLKDFTSKQNQIVVHKHQCFINTFHEFGYSSKRMLWNASQLSCGRHVYGHIWNVQLHLLAWIFGEWNILWKR